MIEIDGPLWFVAAILIVGVHLFNQRAWRREQREYRQWREHYNQIEQQRHDAFMRAIGTDASDWRLDGSRDRGQT